MFVVKFLGTRELQTGPQLSIAHIELENIFIIEIMVAIWTWDSTIRFYKIITSLHHFQREG